MEEERYSQHLFVFFLMIVHQRVSLMRILCKVAESAIVILEATFLILAPQLTSSRLWLLLDWVLELAVFEGTKAALQSLTTNSPTTLNQTSVVYLLPIPPILFSWLDSMPPIFWLLDWFLSVGAAGPLPILGSSADGSFSDHADGFFSAAVVAMWSAGAVSIDGGKNCSD